MKQIAKIILTGAFLLALAAIPASAQNYNGYQPDCQQQGYQNQQPNYDPHPVQQTLVPRTPIDSQTFAVKDLPQVAPFNQQRSSGVVLDTHGNAYYWYGK